MTPEKWQSVFVVLTVGAATAAVIGLLLERMLQKANVTRAGRAAFSVLFFVAFAVFSAAVDPHHVREAVLFGLQTGLLGAACGQLAQLASTRPRHVA